MPNIHVKKTELSLNNLTLLVECLTGVVTPEERVPGILAAVKDFEARYHLLKFLKQVDPILASFNETKDALLKMYLEPGETHMNAKHPKWEEFMEKYAPLIGIKVTVGIPRIEFSRFVGINMNSINDLFYEYVIDNKHEPKPVEIDSLRRQMLDIIQAQNKLPEGEKGGEDAVEEVEETEEVREVEDILKLQEAK